MTVTMVPFRFTPGAMVEVSAAPDADAGDFFREVTRTLHNPAGRLVQFG